MAELVPLNMKKKYNLLDNTVAPKAYTVSSKVVTEPEFQSNTSPTLVSGMSVCILIPSGNASKGEVMSF